MNKRTRWYGLILAITICVALINPGSTYAISPNAPKIGMVCTPGTVAGSTHTFHLVANSDYVATPDGNSVLMWSYANLDAPDNGHFQSPGPVLCVTQGETVVVSLQNGLPEPVSVVFPGQEGVTATGGAPGLLTTEAAAGGSVSYSFSAANPGTYLYESGSNISKQIEMGLYGALVVRPAGHPNWAYDSTTVFDPNREYLLLLSEFDPDLHHAVETGATYDLNQVVNRYFAINGRNFPDTVQDNGSSLLPNQPYGSMVRIQPYNGTSNPNPVLIRMVNVGVANHPFHPHGDHLREIAQDGRLLVSPGGGSASSERFGETIGSGQTQDYLLKWTDQDFWDPNTNVFPVTQPNYRNLTFKDNVTWYAGSPYLGYKGTLPTGTTSLNICGEWYFPLHSHALNEFANFDAGFGGMGTLLRVDPLGGCFAFPTSTKINVGTLNSGTFSNLGLADTKYYKVNSTITGTRTTDWYAQFSNVPVTSLNLKVTYVGNNSVNTASQSVSIWRWNTGTWVPLSGPTNVGTVDVTVNANVPAAPVAGSWANYIGTGSNKGLVRVRIVATRATNFVNDGNLVKLVYDVP